MKKTKKWVIGVSIASVVLSAVTAVSVFAGLHQSKKTTETANLTMYRVGTIDYDGENATGKILDSNHSIVLKEMKSIDGLKVDIDEETATVTYGVAFYNADKEFISYATNLDADFDSSTIPEGAEYFRIVITPLAVDGEPVDVNVFNMSKYESQVEVTYDKA